LCRHGWLKMRTRRALLLIPPLEVSRSKVKLCISNILIQRILPQTYLPPR
jgi:hypothetical protein